uniref:Putative secreted protein n=1 Tax=Ixodes ricinus TaxID=34613 RepID=A0A090XD17_IXORI
MFKPRETMIALFFWGILFFCQSLATSSGKFEGDYPAAIEVMMMLPKTYLFQSAFYISTLDCALQVFFNRNLSFNGLSKSYRMYNLIDLYKTGRYQGRALYVRDFEDYKIILDNRPEKHFLPKRSLLILYSDKRRCMVTKNPESHLPDKACSLLLTEGAFQHPPMECTEAFRRHCGEPARNYTDISKCQQHNNYIQ